MKILLLTRTSHIRSGSGAIVHHLKEKLSDDLLILTQKSAFSNNNLINAEPIIKPLNLPSKGKRFTAWLSWFQTRRARKAGMRATINFEPDIVMSVFPDEYFLYWGRMIAKDLGCPFVPWFHNTLVENRKGLDKLIGFFIQSIVFKDALVVLTISDGLTSYYQNKYPKHRVKFKTLQHGFAPNKSIIKDLSARKIGENIKFGFTGSLNDSCAEAASRLFTVIGSDNKYELHIFSGTSEESFKKLMPDVINYEYHGFIPESDFYGALSRCHINLVAHGFHGKFNPVEYQTIFPTRTIPLLSVERPILVHSPPNAFFTKFMKENDCGFVVDEPNEQILSDMIKTILVENDMVNQKVKNALNTRYYFDIKHTSKVLLNILSEVFDGN